MTYKKNELNTFNMKNREVFKNKNKKIKIVNILCKD